MTAAVADHPPTICTQQSITVPPEAGAKFAQPLLFGSDEWEAAYRTLRSTNEGMNGYLKDGAREALADPQRRRIRGVAAQSVFVAALLWAANLRKIDGFLTDWAAVVAGTIRRRPRRRRTRALDQWLPGQVTPASPATGGPGPDPPTAASERRSHHRFGDCRGFVASGDGPDGVSPDTKVISTAGKGPSGGVRSLVHPPKYQNATRGCSFVVATRGVLSTPRGGGPATKPRCAGHTAC